MSSATVTVTASSSESARDEGARKLGVQPHEVTVEPSGGSSYSVTVKRAPKCVDLIISEDKMMALVTVPTPPQDGKPVTVADVEEALSDSGVSHGIDADGIQQVVAAATASHDAPRTIVVAKGTPPVPGRDAAIDLLVGDGAPNQDPRARFSVRAGQVLAVKTSAANGAPGRNVLGEEMPCGPGKDREFVGGENVAVAEDGMTFTAEMYGTAEVGWNSVSVKPGVRIVNDGESAQMTVYPTLSDGSCLTLEDVLGELARAGVVYGIREDAIAEALKSVQSPQETEVAQATPATAGEDASVAFEFKLNGRDPEEVDALRKAGQLSEETLVKEFVSAGQVLAVKTSLRAAEDGCSVTGNLLSGGKPKDKVLNAGANVTVLDDALTYVVSSGVKGYADLVDGTLCVEDPITVSDDGMAAYLCVQPPTASGRMLTLAEVAKLLQARGLKYGVNATAIKGALNDARGLGKPQFGVLIAEGRAPQKGRDAEITFAFQARQAPGALVEGTDRMDYKERGMLQSVHAGSLLAKKSPSTEGIHGMDVFGKSIPALPGDDKVLTSIQNVAVSDDGLRFTAEIEGVVVLVGQDKIGVFQSYEVPADVDYSTGNLDMDGNLTVHGWIRSGFTVRVRGDLFVGAGIEDAVVEAGGNIEVRGGVIGKTKGAVSATGDITARFVENGHLRSRGNIIVRDSIVNSVAIAEGRVIATEGKGRIIGGTITARKGVEVNEVGSGAAIRTLINVGLDEESLKQLVAYEKEIELCRRIRRKATLAAALAARNTESPAVGVRKDAQLLTKLEKLCRETALREAKLVQYMKSKARTGETDDESVAIQVKKRVTEETIVTIFGCSLLVKNDINTGGRFVMDNDEWAVTYTD